MAGCRRPDRRVLVLCLVFLISSAPAAAQEDPLQRGRGLFIDSCASCHGPRGEGTEFGPSLVRAGAAAADFQLRTGRMPLSDPGDQTVRKPPAFSEREMAQIVAYVSSLGAGPLIPEVDFSEADLSLGQDLFVDNCAPCHGSTANGGAAGSKALAPSLYRAEALDVAEAMVSGPGEMPVFDFDDPQRNSIVAYVEFLQTRSAPGGADIGGIGPVPEGFVAWLLGLGALVAVCYVIGREKHSEERP